MHASTPSPSSLLPNQTLAQRLLWCFIALQVLVWTLVPTLTRHALPMDAAEGVVWGHQLEWGYDRNPWLNGWLTRLAVELGGSSDFFVYFFSQLLVALAFWSVWRLGNRMLMPLQALVAVLMLTAIQYYTLAAIDLNDNVLELGLWPFLTLLLYSAIRSQRTLDWLGVGLVAGLAMMAKYYSAILLLAIFIFMIWNPTARSSFRKPGPYLGLLLLLIIITPHIAWLFQHDFVTIHYALRRVNKNESVTFWHHVQPGLAFAMLQVAAFLGAVGLFLFAWWGSWSSKPERCGMSLAEDTFNRQFLWMVGIGPYILTVLFAVLAGWQLHTLWGTPLLTCWGLLLVYTLKPAITRARLNRFLIATLVVFTALIGAYTWAMLKPGNTSSGNFPGKLFAQEITTIWHTHYQKPLPYVMGERILASSVTRYSPDKPSAHLGWDIKTNPWIDEERLRLEGAVFLQRADEGNDFPPDVRARFPDLKVEGVHYISRVRPAADSKPIAVLVGILAPSNLSQVSLSLSR